MRNKFFTSVVILAIAIVILACGLTAKEVDSSTTPDISLTEEAVKICIDTDDYSGCEIGIGTHELQIGQMIAIPFEDGNESEWAMVLQLLVNGDNVGLGVNLAPHMNDPANVGIIPLTPTANGQLITTQDGSVFGYVMFDFDTNRWYVDLQRLPLKEEFSDALTPSQFMSPNSVDG